MSVDGGFSQFYGGGNGNLLVSWRDWWLVVAMVYFLSFYLSIFFFFFAFYVGCLFFTLLHLLQR